MRPESPFYEKSLNSLANSPVFRDLDRPTLENILAECSLKTWPKSAVIFPEHNQEWFHFIIKGRLEVSKINVDSGREVTIFMCNKGDVFDLLAILQNKKHDVLSTVLEDLECLVAPMPVAREWLIKYPELNKNFLPYVGKHLYELESMTSDLALYDTTARLVKLILRSTEKKSKSNQHYPVKLIDNLSHEQIAKMIGSVRVVVNRSIQKLKQEGIVSTKRNAIIIEDLEKLKENYSHHFN